MLIIHTSLSFSFLSCLFLLLLLPAPSSSPSGIQSPTRPLKRQGLRTPPFHSSLKGFGFYMHPLPPSDQKRQASPLPLPSGHKGEGIKTSSHPLLAKIGTEFKTPSSHVLGKRSGVLEKSLLPSPSGQRKGNSNPPTSLPTSPPLLFPLSLIPSLGHGPSLCPPWAVLGPAWALPRTPRALAVAPP